MRDGLFVCEIEVFHMGERSVFREWEAGTLINAWPDVYFGKGKTRGFVATLDLHSKPARTAFWGLNDMHRLIEITERRWNPYRNTYLSLNAFGKGPDGKVRRREDHLEQIRSIGLDLDCYKFDLSAEQGAAMIRKMIAENEIPNPNLLIRSGHGLQLVYSIEGGAAPTDGMKWLARYITTQLLAKTVRLGADFSCTDLARVFRLPGTLNAKEDMPVKRVDVEIWRPLEYTLNELYAFCKPYRRRSGPGTVVALPNIQENGNKLKAYNLARAEDLIRLVELRSGEIEKRNVMTYDYCFSLTLNDVGQEEVISAARQFDARFSVPQKPNKVEQTARSAYGDAMTFWKAYRENNYRMRGLDRNLIKPKKTSTIILQHDITSDEMAELSKLIDGNEKERRRTQKRRAAGIRPRDEYNAARAAQKTGKVERLAALMDKHPAATQQELADMMGVTRQTINRLLKEK